MVRKRKGVRITRPERVTRNGCEGVGLPAVGAPTVTGSVGGWSGVNNTGGDELKEGSGDKSAKGVEGKACESTLSSMKAGFSRSTDILQCLPSISKRKVGSLDDFKRTGIRGR